MMLPIVVVAGYPDESFEKLKKSGLSHFIHRNSNVLETLTKFNKALLQTI